MTPAEPPGPVLFARYAYPPNSLGYCGPGDPSALLEAAHDVADLDELSRLAARFEGAWPYLQLIASSNGMPDPLDRRVVEAYWVGNELLDGVPAAALEATVRERFGEREGRASEAPGPQVPAAGVAQHGLHVFAVYPWLGLLRRGLKDPSLHVLDRCRIRWGRVEALSGDLVTVRSMALAFDGDQLRLGAEAVEEARRPSSGALAVEIEPGDTVSLHWDWVCDRLSPGALAWLQRCTERNLAAVNSSGQPASPEACGA